MMYQQQEPSQEFLHPIIGNGYCGYCGSELDADGTCSECRKAEEEAAGRESLSRVGAEETVNDVSYWTRQ